MISIHAFSRRLQRWPRWLLWLRSLLLLLNGERGWLFGWGNSELGFKNEKNAGVCRQRHHPVKKAASTS